MEAEKFQHWLDIPISHSHELYMKRALELATNGRGYVSPNPLVGCVIVNDGRIIGEGWHKKFGEGHAEVNAIDSVPDKSLLSTSTLYVTLEPCSHFGKTPPCADLITELGIPKVVIANFDVNPLVAGGGIKKLEGAGVKVTTEILSTEGKELNKRFFTWMLKKRPYIILKWAATADGFIARLNNSSKWISDAYSRQIVHKWRSEEDAVLVGSGTAWHDHPNLNVRDWSGRNPVRIVIDRYLKLGSNQHLFDHSQKTICYNLVKEEEQKNLSFVLLKKDDFIELLLEDLYKKNIQSVIVEGGARILNSFIEKKLWDEARVFVSPQKFDLGIPAPPLNALLKEQHKLHSDWYRLFMPLS
jgi:diaminohydroxyphosphoribosylaminopyrimidine deaminase/5-amino-6-(5-phosphoribosylamino)uracil reductase